MNEKLCTTTSKTQINFISDCFSYKKWTWFRMNQTVIAELRCYQLLLFFGMGSPRWFGWANDQWLDLEWNGLMSAELRICTVKYPILKSMDCPWWACDHDVVHMQSKAITMSLIWCASSWWQLSYYVHKVWCWLTDDWKQLHSPSFSLWKAWGQ